MAFHFRCILITGICHFQLQGIFLSISNGKRIRSGNGFIYIYILLFDLYFRQSLKRGRAKYVAIKARTNRYDDKEIKDKAANTLLLLSICMC